MIKVFAGSGAYGLSKLSEPIHRNQIQDIYIYGSEESARTLFNVICQEPIPLLVGLRVRNFYGVLRS